MDQEAAARRNCGQGLPKGVEIRDGKRRASLRVTFTYNSDRCRETLDIEATPANIKYAGKLVGEIENRIARGTFDYAEFFPNSRRAGQISLQTKRYTIGELVDRFIDAGRKTESMSPSTVATYVKWQRARLFPKWGDRWADEVTTGELRAWIVDLIAELAPKSVRNCVGVLSAVLTVATTDGYIKANPLTPISMKAIMPKRRKAKDEDKIDPFNSAEIAAILAACSRPQERALFQFAFATGLRTGELIALKWKHIDWIRNQIHVEDNIVSGEVGTVEKTTKTDMERDIPMLPAARQALEIMRPMTSMLKIGDYVFSYDGKNRWRHDTQVRERWTIILKLAKVRYRNPYQTRHTFASTLLMNSEPELLVAKLLGHTTVEMVRKHYGRFIKQPEGIVLRSAYAEFGANLGQQTQEKTALPRLMENGTSPENADGSRRRRKLKAV
ncbi:Arm DNA-binding domain-containing protein [Pseudomonas sp.]|uniref:Arm DNA-binding domain-containing protein n=1 Tax=Pseudomonas sp. TaxID=306 RepID=UPI003F410460